MTWYTKIEKVLCACILFHEIHMPFVTFSNMTTKILSTMICGTDFLKLVFDEIYLVLGNEMNTTLTFLIKRIWVLKRHAQMNDMNDGPAWGLNPRSLAYKVNALPTELSGLAFSRHGTP